MRVEDSGLGGGGGAGDAGAVGGWGSSGGGGHAVGLSPLRRGAGWIARDLGWRDERVDEGAACWGSFDGAEARVRTAAAVGGVVGRRAGATGR